MGGWDKHTRSHLKANVKKSLVLDAQSVHFQFISVLSRARRDDDEEWQIDLGISNGISSAGEEAVSGIWRKTWLGSGLFPFASFIVTRRLICCIISFFSIAGPLSLDQPRQPTLFFVRRWKKKRVFRRIFWVWEKKRRWTWANWFFFLI